MKNEGRNLTLTHIPYDDVLETGGETKDEWYLQITRIMASQLNYQAQCPISACRRNKFCCGRISKAQHALGIGYHPLFPPCTNGEEDRRQAILRLLGRMIDDQQASQ